MDDLSKWLFSSSGSPVAFVNEAGDVYYIDGEYIGSLVRHTVVREGYRGEIVGLNRYLYCDDYKHTYEDYRFENG